MPNPNHIFTLENVFEKKFSEKSMRQLLAHVGPSNVPLRSQITLGDVALQSGPTEAWWCTRVLPSTARFDVIKKDVNDMSKLIKGTDVAKIILEERSYLLNAQKQGTRESWKFILDNSQYWALRHQDQNYSVIHMSDRELQQAFVEDLLFVAYHINEGANAFYQVYQPIKHLKDKNSNALHQITRIKQAIDVVLREGYALAKWDKFAKEFIFLLNPDKMNEAQDFSGVYISDYSVDYEDMVDNIMSVGGEDLLADTIDDLIRKIK